jgi:cold shock CspA family protein
MEGFVKFWNDKGYGFIETKDRENEIFVHYSEIKTKDEFKKLEKGNKVSFEVATQEDGREKAINVSIIK